MLDHIELSYGGETSRGKCIFVQFFGNKTDLKLALYDEELLDVAEKFSRYAHGRLRPCLVSSPYSRSGCSKSIYVYVTMNASSHAVVMHAVDRILNLMDLRVDSAQRLRVEGE